jgi:predicted DNA-binding ribbon-helix-helix protein
MPDEFHEPSIADVLRSPHVSIEAANANRRRTSTLCVRNVTVNGNRTSVRLEPEIWESLLEISQREKLTIHQICSLVASRIAPGQPLTSSLRVFTLVYFRQAATEDGHARSRHGHQLRSFANQGERELSDPAE